MVRGWYLLVGDGTLVGNDRDVFALVDQVYESVGATETLAGDQVYWVRSRADTSAMLSKDSGGVKGRLAEDGERRNDAGAEVWSLEWVVFDSVGYPHLLVIRNSLGRVSHILYARSDSGALFRSFLVQVQTRVAEVSVWDNGDGRGTCFRAADAASLLQPAPEDAYMCHAFDYGALPYDHDQNPAVAPKTGDPSTYPVSYDGTDDPDGLRQVLDDILADQVGNGHGDETIYALTGDYRGYNAYFNYKVYDDSHLSESVNGRYQIECHPETYETHGSTPSFNHIRTHRDLYRILPFDNPLRYMMEFQCYFYPSLTNPQLKIKEVRIVGAYLNHFNNLAFQANGRDIRANLLQIPITGIFDQEDPDERLRAFCNASGVDYDYLIREGCVPLPHVDDDGSPRFRSPVCRSAYGITNLFSDWDPQSRTLHVNPVLHEFVAEEERTLVATA
jgi:hypothetical protein